MVKNDQVSPDSIIDRMIELQKQWPELVTPRPKEVLLDLLEKDLVQLLWENGRIVATNYIQPLIDELPVSHSDQIFRMGGFASDKRNGIDKRMLFVSMYDFARRLQERKYKIIAKNGNHVVTRFFKDVGYHEVSYDECRERFPEFLEAYLRKSVKSLEYYYDKYFCIYHPEFCI